MARIPAVHGEHEFHRSQRKGHTFRDMGLVVMVVLVIAAFVASIR